MKLFMSTDYIPTRYSMNHQSFSNMSLFVITEKDIYHDHDKGGSPMVKKL